MKVTPIRIAVPARLPVPVLALTLAAALVAGCGGPDETAQTPGDNGPGGAAATANAPDSGAAPSGSTAESGSASGESPAGPNAGQEGGPTKLDADKYKTTESGLKYAIIKEGTGKEAKAGDVVHMHYTGWLQSDNKKFDSSRDRGETFSFPLGTGQVIPGWDEGVAGMKEGEQRQLIIPANLGYGDRGAGADIPPGATLVFDVELVKVGA